MWAAKFCSKIVLTDREETVLNLIQRNIDENTFPRAREKPSVEMYEWGNSLRDIFSKHGAFDLIIAAEVM